ncbi:MAG: glycerol-3-phosphate dehydrogenase [Paracoccaceae bacterium]|nr:glycerol-3-phosphate dehydrogenase [Paracoccaceae bacterium]
MEHPAYTEITDLFIIGGGINGCGIARDATGRGVSVALAEMNDLASATSSASTKLFHGGLRYLEYFEFRLVREALIERETLLKAMPHISWPMRFVLPYHKDMRFESDTPTSKLLSLFMPWLKGRRPAWLIRLGLFMYDHLGGRKILPGTATLDMTGATEGAPLQDRFTKAYEYSDCWVEDSRLVVLNARDAEARGARIMTRTQVVSATSEDGIWRVETRNNESGETKAFRARMLVNAGGPWVGDIIQSKVRLNSREGVRLVRGSHIVTRKLYDHDKCYFFQGADGRIIFAIPYETDFTLIGTTDAEHGKPSKKPVCTPDEQDYLLGFVNQYFKQQLTRDDVVWTYSGVRPLYDDGASSATAATRDYTLKVETSAGAPVLNIFGGKITTYRRLAESAMEKIGEPVNLRVGFKVNIWFCEIIKHLADRRADQSPCISDGGLFKSLWRQPVRQRQHSRPKKCKDRNPSRFNLLRRNHRPTLFFGFHFSEISARPNEARTFSGIIWRPRLRLQRLVTQVAHVSPNRANQVILSELCFWDHPFPA